MIAGASPGFSTRSAQAFLEVADHATVSSIAELANGIGINVLRDKADRTVRKQSVASANVQTEGFIVRTAVIDSPWAGSRSTDRGVVLVDDADRSGGCVRRTRDTVAGIAVSPTVRTGQSTAGTAHVEYCSLN